MLNRNLVPAAVVTVFALALAAPAAAHVTLQPSEAPAGQFVRLDVRVPNERDDESTTKVQVQFPPGFPFVSYEPVAGWSTKVTTEKAATPIKAEGETFTEQVSEVTWTGKGQEGKIGPGQFQDFGLSLQMPDKAGTKLTFKALQTYEGGEVVRWIGAPDSEEPAPQVELTASTEPGREPTTPEDDDEETDTLTIVALVVGGLGLVAGGAAFARERRR